MSPHHLRDPITPSLVPPSSEGPFGVPPQGLQNLRAPLASPITSRFSSPQNSLHTPHHLRVPPHHLRVSVSRLSSPQSPHSLPLVPPITSGTPVGCAPPMTSAPPSPQGPRGAPPTPRHPLGGPRAAPLRASLSPRHPYLPSRASAELRPRDSQSPVRHGRGRDSNPRRPAPLGAH